jgi:hypothetical protein
MTVEREQLKRYAEAATPGPWYYDGRDIFTTHTGEGGHRLVVPLPETWHESQRVNEADARYIAALSPDVLLGLLAHLDAAERLVESSFGKAEAYREAAVLSERLQREAEKDARLLADALSEIVKRERRSDYTSIYAAPGEFARIARDALAAWNEPSNSGAFASRKDG